jgi:hypothetical protein
MPAGTGGQAQQYEESIIQVIDYKGGTIAPVMVCLFLQTVLCPAGNQWLW